MNNSASEAPRYATLQDYIRVIRRRKLVIVVFTLAAAIAAFVVSSTQSSVYEATTQLSFQDVTQDLDLIGGGGGGDSVGATERAAANAELITRPSISKRVQEDLDTELPLGAVQDAVTTRVGFSTNLVILTAGASEPQLAADIANGYARAAVEAGTQETRNRLAQLERTTERELQDIAGSEITSPFRLQAVQQRLSLIGTLRDIAEPVEIALPASVPSTRVSPKPVRDTILGSLLGLVVGLLAAFVRDSLDKRLHSAHEAHEELGMPVLGRVSDSAFGYPGLAESDRPAMREADFEAFRILRTNLSFMAADAPLRTILVTSGLPEEGKSTVSTSLASACVMAGQRVLLIEADLRRPSLARRLGIEPSPGLTDYLVGNAKPQDVLRLVELVEPGSMNGAKPESRVAGALGTLVCITAGTQVSNPSELLVGQRFQDFIEKVRRAYDIVILDTSPLLSVVDPLELVSRVDGVLLCVRAGRTTRDEARATRAAISNLPARPMGAVVTGLRRGGPSSHDYYYNY